MSVAPSASVGNDPSLPLAGRHRVAYVVSRFPKITETFILFEMLAMEEQGIEVSLYPLQRERTHVMHPEAAAYMEGANFAPLISPPILRSNLHYLFAKPRAYLGALSTLLRANWGSSRYFFFALGFFPKMVHFAKCMEAAGIDHVHAHFASHPAAAAFVIRRLTTIPYSFTAHGSDLHRDRHMLKEKVEEATHVVPISEYNRKLILETCGREVEEKLVLIHCGTDTGTFEPRAGHEDVGEDASGQFTILSIGTLHEVKGQRHLIDACARLRERGIEVDCHFIGDGEDDAALRDRAAAANLSDHVHFHGRQPRSEVVRRLREADAVVAPSVPTSDGRREGIPVVLMEAMSCAIPVVASDISGIPELVEDGRSGLLVPPADVEAIADALEKLSKNPELRRQLGAAARERVRQEFDVAVNANSLARLFRKSRRC